MKKVLLTIVIFVICLTFYGFFINTNGFSIKSQIIEIEDLSKSFDGFKILQLSDFLIKDEKDLSRIEDISNKIEELNPDVIVFTGDLLYKDNNLNNEDINRLKNILKKMEANLNKYAVIGDNDEKKEYSDIMNYADFKVLNNESNYIFYKDVTPIKITGLTSEKNVLKSLEMEDNLETSFNFVITHYPDYFNTLKNEDVDVVLAGHSLNGQIIVPFYGGLIKCNKAKYYINGSYIENGAKLFISGGIGTKDVNFRLFNKPQINLYTLAIA